MSGARVRMKWVQSDYLNEENVEEMLGDVSAVLVAPGFGERGIDGKLTAVTYARENGIPFLGICLGMQCAVIEFARNCRSEEHTSELQSRGHLVCRLLLEKKKTQITKNTK